MPERTITPVTAPQSYADLRRGVETALLAGQRDIERAKVHTYWETGRLINEHILLHDDRADYGAKVFTKLETDLKVSKRVLYQCAQFARLFPIVNGRSPLAWAHYRVLCQVEDGAQRKLLAAEAVKNAWTAAQLEERIRPLNLAALGSSADPPASAAPPKLLAPQRGTPGLHLIVERTAGDLAIDLGFKLYQPLSETRQSRFAKGDIVRLAADGSVRRADDATKADLFTYAAALRRVVDGDTLVVALEVAPGIFLEQKLRLRGLDCPELSTPEGKTAKRFVDTLVAQTTAVVINTTKPDKYDRYLADVFLQTDPDSVSQLSSLNSQLPEIFLNNTLLENAQAVRKDAWEFRDWDPDLFA